MKQIRVLHLIHWLTRGGIEKWLLSMLQEMPQDECRMDFCCKGPSVGELAGIAKEAGAKIHHIPLGLSHIRYGAALKSLLKNYKYDVVHNHLQTYSGYPVKICRSINMPIITSFHNTNFAAQTFLNKPVLKQLRYIYSKISVNYAIRNSNLITGCSKGVLNELVGDSWLQNEKMGALYYGVHLPPLATENEKTKFRKEQNWPESCPVVVHVGSFKEQKNHLGLLKIFKIIVEKIPSARLLLIGDGPLRPKIESEIKALGLASKCKLLGTRDDVSRIMTYCDIFLFPSFYEGFGLVALEANAAGLPVVGSAVEGLTEAVENGQTAILHNVNDIDGMAKSVRKLLNDKKYAEIIGGTGRKRINEKFTSEAAAENLLALYRKLLSANES